MPIPETPKLTVDIIIELVDRPNNPVVLIERKFPPTGWALPGGFVDVGETLEHAAVREAKEETSLDVKLVSLLGCYSDPSRDARHHTVSAVYVAQARGEPVAADDASAVRLLKIGDDMTNLAFDHARIIADYQHFLKTGEPTPLNPVQTPEQKEL